MKRFFSTFMLVLFSILIFSCSKESSPTLTVQGPHSFAFNSDGGMQSFTFQANRSWSITSSEPWIRVSPSSGTSQSGEITVTITVSPNTTYDARIAKITIKIDGQSEAITVSQEMGQGLVVPTATYNITNAAQTLEVEVQKNVSYTVIIDDSCKDWIKQTGTRGLSSEKLIFSIEANTTYDDRIGNITLMQANGSLSQTIVVKQGQADGLLINDNEVNVSWKNEIYDINVQSNIDYEIVVSDPSWVTAEIVSTKGLVNSKIRLSIKANVEFKERSQTIIVKDKDGAIERQIKINQNSQDEIVDLGLSVKWRAYNLGAKNMTDCGNYYAWGETETKEQYVESNYKWYKDGDINQVTKYNIANYGWPNRPEPDNRYIIEPEDDASYTSMGGFWRMPTYFEANELIENCSAEFESDYFGTGIPGFIFTSKVEGFEGTKLFMPTTGLFVKTLKHKDTHLEIWTSTQHNCLGGLYQASAAWALCGNTYTGWIGTTEDIRDIGYPIRPVYDSQHHTQGIFVDNIQNKGRDISLLEGYDYKLTASYYPVAGIDNNIHWRSEDESIATVNQEGVVTAIAPGNIGIIASVDNGVSARQGFSIIAKQKEEYVDMGLSVLWATCNLGADSFEKNGNYYAWGETTTHQYYDWDNYAWGIKIDNNVYSLNKYITNDSYGIVDNLVELEKQDDVVAVNLGNGWRMPSSKEYQELLDNSTLLFQYNYINTGINGTLVVSNVAGYEGNSLFFPQAGYAIRGRINAGVSYYLSTSLDVDKNEKAKAMEFSYPKIQSVIRSYGWPIRPVKQK